MTVDPTVSAPRTLHRDLLKHLLAAAPMIALSVGPAMASVWTSNIGGNWSDGTKWDSIPDGEGAVASITANFTGGGKGIVIDTTSRTVGTLNIGDSDSGSTLTLSASGGATLTFNGAGDANAQINKSVGNIDTISAPIILGSGLDITNNSANVLVISGSVTGSNAISINGTGITRFSTAASNTGFTGGIVLNSGTLSQGSAANNVFGTGAITITGGTFNSDNVSNLLTDNHSLNLNGSFRVTSGSGGVTFSGAATIGGNITITASAGSASGRNTTFSNIAGGTGNITFDANGSVGDSGKQGIRIGTANHNGSITNASTGSGWVIVTGALGANVTGVTQNSATSTMQLSGNNLFTGSMTVTKGTLLVNGTNSNLAGVSVASEGKLGGTGTIGLGSAKKLSVASGGHLAPGLSPGILTVTGTQTGTPGAAGDATLNLASGSALDIEIAGLTAGTGYDRINLTGTLSLGGATLNVFPTLALGANQFFTIIQNDGTGSDDAVLGTFNGLAEGSVVLTDTNTNYYLRISYTGEGGALSGTGNDVLLYTSPVPEPTSIGLAGLALAGLLARRRKGH